MKKQMLLLVIMLILITIATCVSATAKSRPKEVFLHGEVQADGSIRYETEDGMYVIASKWE